MTKGKKGEMKATEIISVIAQKEQSLDFTRHTNTYTPDNGSDIFIDLDKMLIAKFMEILQNGYSDLKCDTKANANFRIDVKNSPKVGKDDAEKFYDDIKKHPRSMGHILLGHSFTAKAKEILKDAQSAYPNKLIVCFGFDEFEILANYYRSLPDYDE